MFRNAAEMIEATKGCHTSADRVGKEVQGFVPSDTSATGMRYAADQMDVQATRCKGGMSTCRRSDCQIVFIERQRSAMQMRIKPITEQEFSPCTHMTLPEVTRINDTIVWALISVLLRVISSTKKVTAGVQVPIIVAKATPVWSNAALFKAMPNPTTTAMGRAGRASFS
mmetsp:Transcript_70930/g.125378  ORF Transcript_70930/g.125378 Transcript_70930/m.125378 type:complete len:169 (-) Transcript_70930:582-1088(-)